jgi:hypothetical protein
MWSFKDFTSFNIEVGAYVVPKSIKVYSLISTMYTYKKEGTNAYST